MVTAMQGLLLYLYEQDTYPYHNSTDTTAGMSNLKHFYLLCIEKLKFINNMMQPDIDGSEPGGIELADCSPPASSSGDVLLCCL